MGKIKLLRVLLVGGSSQIPAVIRVLKQRFGKNLVHTHRPIRLPFQPAQHPLFLALIFFDYIQHDYAIRFVNPIKKRL